MLETKPKFLDLTRYTAVIFDMDGVITRSARTHAKAWKMMFDEYLQERAGRTGEKFVPFDDEKEYLLYVDGKPRYKGVQSFLESRGIKIPYGSPSDPPEKETICGLGNRKNKFFLDWVQKHGVESYESTIKFIKHLKERKLQVAVVTSSKNSKVVLRGAHVLNLFPVVVDGVEAAILNLKGKPAPDMFQEAVRRLNVKPENAVVIEDAISGVEAGKAGGFGLVIGVNRGDNPELKNHGADIVVNDLSEIQNGNGNEAGESTAVGTGTKETNH
jgi:beta-phosphoglucomutase family hydrolase